MFFIKNRSTSPAIYQELCSALRRNHKKVDRAFVWLVMAEWLIAILTAVFVSPYFWPESTAFNLWLATLGGGVLALVPTAVVSRRAGTLFSRQCVAACQVLFSALFVHLTAGRHETYFHLFISMSLLVAYRDRSVFLSTLTITAICQLCLGYYSPQSVWGRESFSITIFIEHMIWLLVSTAGLSYIVGEKLRQCIQNASLQHDLKVERDLLENRVAERTKSLKWLKMFHEEILNSIDSIICILDSRGRIVFHNENWANFVEEYGISASCGLGASYLESYATPTLGSSELVRVVAGSIKLIAIGESDSFYTEYSTKLGEETRYYRLGVTPVALDGELGVAIVHVDTTHLTRAERRASAFAKLVQESPAEVLIASYESTQFIEANEGAMSNTGYERSEFLKMNLLELLEDSTALRDAMFRISANRERVVIFESQVKRKDTSDYPGRISLHRTQFEESEVWVLFITDLTDQKKLEFKLAQAQKLESLGTLAAGIAHEINTPMQCVVGNFEFLQNSFDKLTGLSDRLVELLDSSTVDWSAEREQLQQLRREYKYDFLRKQTPMALSEATDSSRQIVSIVRAMKAMSHPGTEDAVETDVHELIRDASIISRNRWKYVAEMSFNFSENVPMILAFPAELSQVFINLFVNSTDAIIERLGHTPQVLGLISVETKLSNDNLIIRVKDTGSGIPANIVSKIFDPFFTTKPVGKGTGQGLSITHSVIVGKHQGSISVSSEVGIGTVFTITLPVKQNTPVNKAASPKLELSQTSHAPCNNFI